MPLYVADISIPPSTPKDDPVTVNVKLDSGILRKVWVIIPPGHAALAHLVIKWGATQIIPYVGDIHGDNEQLVFDEWIEINEPERVLTLVGWNEDIQYTHRFIVRFLVLPREVAMPELRILQPLRVLMEAMGVI